MTRRELADRLVEQFSVGGDRADVWRAFDLLLPTDRFLNLGYSGRAQTHLVGSPQRRLVDRVVDEVVATAGDSPSGRWLDLGCGRGGTATHVAETRGIDVVGLDLVPYNVQVAADQAVGVAPRPAFVTGDATALPFADDVFAASVAVDAIVYVPEKRVVFSEVNRVLEPGGVCVFSDLLVRSGTAGDDGRVARFTDAWDMPALWDRRRYLRTMEAAGLRVGAVTDLTPHSVGGFRRWTTLFLSVAGGPLGSVLEGALTRRGVDPSRMISQVRAAHAALPDLRHVLVTARA